MVKDSIERYRIILRVVKYFLFEGTDIALKLRKHFELIKVLAPFKNANLINSRTHAIYLFSYISKSLNIDEKLQILAHNYTFLHQVCPANQLKQLFKKGIELYKEWSGEDEYSVSLTYSSLLEFEGSLSLLFNVNGTKVFTLSFTFVPGKIFNNNDDKTVIYVSCLQGVKNQFDTISKATKHFQDIIPPVILLKALEALAVTLNIKKILGIPAKNQLSFGEELDYQTFYANYDEFWKIVGGKLIKGSYVITCPMIQKSILLIKQNHRNRTIKKRRKLNIVFDHCFDNLDKMLTPTTTDNITCCIVSRFSLIYGLYINFR